jgi:hypothetical protein
VDIRDGHFVYRDAGTGTVLHLDGVRQRLRVSGDLRQDGVERLRLDGSLDIGGLSLTSPEHFATPIRDAARKSLADDVVQAVRALGAETAEGTEAPEAQSSTIGTG